MIIYGWREKTLKSYEDSHITCGNCGAHSQLFTVFQKYFHIFWIPFFPIGRKKIACQCTQCNDGFNTEKKDHYLSMTRTPITLFIGSILVGIIVLTNVINHKIYQSAVTGYANDPQAGDVYLMKTEHEGQNVFHFMKVFDTAGDTVYLYQNSYYYNKALSEISDEDYFIDNDVFFLLREEIPAMKKEGVIRDVIRKYSESSNFHREFSVEYEEDEEDWSEEI